MSIIPSSALTRRKGSDLIANANYKLLCARMHVDDEIGDGAMMRCGGRKRRRSQQNTKRTEPGAYTLYNRYTCTKCTPPDTTHMHAHISTCCPLSELMTMRKRKRIVVYPYTVKPRTHIAVLCNNTYALHNALYRGRENMFKHAHHCTLAAHSAPHTALHHTYVHGGGFVFCVLCAVRCPIPYSTNSHTNTKPNRASCGDGYVNVQCTNAYACVNVCGLCVAVRADPVLYHHHHVEVADVGMFASARIAYWCCCCWLLHMISR